MARNDDEVQSCYDRSEKNAGKRWAVQLESALLIGKREHLYCFDIVAMGQIRYPVTVSGKTSSSDVYKQVTAHTQEAWRPPCTMKTSLFWSIRRPCLLGQAGSCTIIVGRTICHGLFLILLVSRYPFDKGTARSGREKRPWLHQKCRWYAPRSGERWRRIRSLTASAMPPAACMMAHIADDVVYETLSDLPFPVPTGQCVTVLEMISLFGGSPRHIRLMHDLSRPLYPVLVSCYMSCSLFVISRVDIHLCHC